MTVNKPFAVLPLTLDEYQFIQAALSDLSDGLDPRPAFKGQAIDLWDKINALPFDKIQAKRIRI